MDDETLFTAASLGAAMKMKPKEITAVTAISFLIISVSSPRIMAKTGLPTSFHQLTPYFYAVNFVNTLSKSLSSAIVNPWKYKHLVVDFDIFD